MIGGTRIPFCRSNSLYADLSNLDMMTAALNGLVDRYNLKGEHIDEVVGGAVVTHSQGFQPHPRSVLGTKLAPSTPGITLHTGLRHEPASRARHGRQDRHRRNRQRHRLRLRHHLRCADRLLEKVLPAPDRTQHQEDADGQGPRLPGLLARRTRAPAAGRRRAAHRARHGRALRTDGAGVGHHPRRSGSARLRKPHQGRRRLRARLLSTI